MLRRALCVMAGLLVACGAALALPRDRTIRQLHHTAWTARDGAPSQISCLAQTTDGYLWIGAAHGLYRFDGVQFERFSPRDVPLPSHNIYALAATPDNGLWISFRPTGLGFLKDGKITVWTRPEDLPDIEIFTLASDRDGRIWAGTHSGLWMRSGSKWIDIGAEWNLRPERVWHLYVDRAGTLWVATTSSIAFLRRGWTRFEHTGARGDGVRTIRQSRDGELWIGDRDSARPLITKGPRRDVEVSAKDLLVDRDGVLWIMDNDDGGVVRTSSPGAERSIDRFTAADGLTSNFTTVVLEDREGNVWVGTQKGLDRFRDAHIAPVALPDGHLVLTLLAGEKGTVWAASALRPSINHISHDRVFSYRAPIQASSVFRHENGDVWWGGEGGIFRQRGEEMVFFPQPENMLPETWMWEVVGSDDDGLWVHPDRFKLVHFKDGRWSGRPGPRLVDEGPSATFTDARGRVWLGYTRSFVEVLDRGRMTTYTSRDGIDVGRIRVIRGRGPHYWFGGERGLAVFRNGRFQTVLSAEGERFGTVSGIIETADGTLWLNEMRGIIRIRAEEARAVAAGKRDRVRFRLFDFLDGLPGSPQMNFTVSTAVEATDGRLWFATDAGLARIDPGRERVNKVPPLVSIISINGATASNLRFPVHTENIAIRYTATSLSIPERVRFRYKLEGVDQHWQEAGTRREAFYTNLRPGPYTFQVMASNNDGVWSTRAASVRFELLPAFHQTRWFFALCVVAAAVMLWIAYLLRVRQVAARMQQLHDERMDERIRIAHELHDTLLQGVLSTSMQLQVLDKQIPSEAKPLFGHILKRMSGVIEEGRQALRGLRASDSHESLEQAFSDLKHELAGDFTGGFRVIVTGDRRPLDPAVRGEIYRIGREALVNAFRHAQANNVEVEIEFLGNRLVLRIRDDGRGIDAAVLQSGLDNHFGLAGMRERAEQIGGQLRVISRPGAGTEIELSVPLAGKPHFWRAITISRRPNRRASTE